MAVLGDGRTSALAYRSSPLSPMVGSMSVTVSLMICDEKSQRPRPSLLDRTSHPPAIIFCQRGISVGEPMDRSKRLFSPPFKQFNEAFPTLEDILFEYVVYDYGCLQTDGHGDSGKRRFNLRQRGGLLACRNPRCYRGGYELDQEVFTMLREGVTEKEVTLSCPGDEGTTKTRRGRTCSYSVEGKLTLILRKAESASPEPPPLAPKT